MFSNVKDIQTDVSPSSLGMITSSSEKLKNEPSRRQLSGKTGLKEEKKKTLSTDSQKSTALNKNERCIPGYTKQSDPHNYAD